tara:strand:- start:2406 stop:3506 length:1101 start_codon:yes stop_codon:yes gene_type:complete
MFELLENLRETYETATLVVVAAFGLGILFGVIAEISRYCTRAAIAEWATPAQPGPASRNRTAQVGFAVLAALIGTQAMQYAGLIDLSGSIYWSVAIRPLPLLVGGLLFGIGMVLAGGCVSRLLVLAASGNFRAVVTILVTGIAAYATLRGILALPRIELENLFASELTPAGLFEDNGNLAAVFAAGIAAVAAAVVLTTRRHGLARAILPGVAIGLLVVLGWFITGVVGNDDFEPTQLASLTFVAPVAESVQYLMIFTGDTVRFSIAMVGGVLAGAFSSALLSGRFRFQGFVSEGSILRYLSGGVLMGFGGVTALGCTVGQGLSGLSTAAPSSVIALGAILAGGFATMKFQATRQVEAKPSTLIAAE